MKKLALAAHLVLMVALLTSAAAFAQATEVEFTGTVTAVDDVAGTVDFETDGGDTYTVIPPDDFDLEVEVGQVYEVEGTLNEDGLVEATKMVLESEDEEVEFTGTVTGVDLDAGTVDFETEDGDTYTVIPPDGFDLSSVEEGQVYEVEGTLNEDGLVVATTMDLQSEEEEDEGEIGYFCREDTEEQHPFAAALAETYEVEYEQVMAWFCDDGFGFGQIMLALQTAQMEGVDAGDLLARRAGGEGWGQIWIDMGVIGHQSEAGPPGRPDWAGPPDDIGPPEGAGPPDDIGPPEDAGRPDDAGPPPGAGPGSSE